MLSLAFLGMALVAHHPGWRVFAVRWAPRAVGVGLLLELLADGALRHLPTLVDGPPLARAALVVSLGVFLYEGVPTLAVTRPPPRDRRLDALAYAGIAILAALAAWDTPLRGQVFTPYLAAALLMPFAVARCGEGASTSTVRGGRTAAIGMAGLAVIVGAALVAAHRPVLEAHLRHLARHGATPVEALGLGGTLSTLLGTLGGALGLRLASARARALPTATVLETRADGVLLSVGGREDPVSVRFDRRLPLPAVEQVVVVEGARDAARDAGPYRRGHGWIAAGWAAGTAEELAASRTTRGWLWLAGAGVALGAAPFLLGVT
jgi:hypothetical protein